MIIAITFHEAAHGFVAHLLGDDTAGVGHYGVFSGKRWESQIYPILKNVILSSD